MKILYFAWLRERVGAASEEIDPGDAATARDRSWFMPATRQPRAPGATRR